MSHACKQENRGADYTVSRTIPIELTLNQEQLQGYEAQLDNQIRFKLKSEGNLEVQYDATLLGFTQVLLQLDRLRIKLRDSRWFRMKTAWYSFVDNNVATQAKARPKPCCNRVPRL